MEKELKYNDITIKYFLKKGRQKNLYLKYRDPHLIVSAPKTMSLQIIEKFLLTHWDKIIKWSSSRTSFLETNFNSGHVYFLGNKYPLKINPDFENNKVLFNNQEFFSINLKTNKKQDALKYFDNYLRKQASILIPQRVTSYATLMNLQYSEVKIRLMKAKWGLCHYQKQRLVFNYKIMHYGLDVIDYLVVHELAHLKHPNHSPAFWNFVSLFCFDYKNLRLKLKQGFSENFT